MASLAHVREFVDVPARLAIVHEKLGLDKPPPRLASLRDLLHYVSDHRNEDVGEDQREEHHPAK